MTIGYRRIIMQTIQASEFKAKCLALMDDVARLGKILVVTKNGRPIAELHSYSGGKSGSHFGLHSKPEITGDILSPVDDDAWKAFERSFWIPMRYCGWIATMRPWDHSPAI